MNLNYKNIYYINIMSSLKNTDNDLITETENNEEEEEVLSDEEYYEDGDYDSVVSGDEDLEDVEQIGDDEDEEIIKNEEIVSDDKRSTRPFMTKYELVRIIGTRKKQLSLGAKPMVKVVGKLTIDEIINEEIKHNMVPLKIKRPLPDSNLVEIWRFDELSKKHLL